MLAHPSCRNRVAEKLRYERLRPELNPHFKIAESLQHLSEFNSSLRGFLTFDYGGAVFSPEDASPGLRSGAAALLETRQEREEAAPCAIAGLHH